MGVLASTLLVRTALAGYVVHAAHRNPCPSHKQAGPADAAWHEL